MQLNRLLEVLHVKITCLCTKGLLKIYAICDWGDIRCSHNVPGEQAMGHLLLDIITPLDHREATVRGF